MLFVAALPLASNTRISSPWLGDEGSVKVNAAEVVSQKYWYRVAAVVAPEIAEDVHGEVEIVAHVAVVPFD